MRTKGKRHLLVLAVGIIVSISGLLSCDPMIWCHVYIDNETSGRCVLYAINDSNSLSKKDSIVINSGESALFISDEEFGTEATIEWAQSVVYHWTRVDYRYGIRIIFEDGSSIDYYPDSVNTQIHSPYDNNSYSYNHVKKHIVNASYVISEIE